MKYQIKFLFILILMLAICLSKVENKKILNNNIIELDSDTKDWDKEDRKIKDPELRKLLKKINIEFKDEKNYLKKEFKKELEALRKEYLNKREKLKKEYKQNDKPDKPKKIRPNKKKIKREKELENKIQELNQELERIKNKNNKK